ncbi:mechanosensitive ion channel domain-containing protein [Martelella sp. HB161492]|uniref:mechanosensitive ion channel family protein n=1 Tax=Martelella sp. HB161492 TaxID=2720726 RepID=UPI001592798E|nr:mechanosensitive ion channel domain-containing protein [Martelella sp. HB161492]
MMRRAAIALAAALLPATLSAGQAADGEDAASAMERLGTIFSFLTENATAAALRLESLVAGIAGFPAETAAFLRLLDDEGFSLSAILFRAFLCLGAGAVAEVLFRFIFRKMRRGFTKSGPVERAIHLSGDFVAIVIFALVGGWPLLMSVQGDPGAQLFVVSYLGAFLIMRGFALLVRIPLAPHHPSMRIVALSDVSARRLYWQSVVIFGLALFFLATTTLLSTAGMSADKTLTLALLSRSVVALLLMGACLSNRKAIAAILATDPQGRSRGLGWKSLSAVWHLFAIFYICLSWFFTSILLLLNRPQAGSLAVLSFMILLAMVVACLLMDDWAARAEAGERARRWRLIEEGKGAPLAGDMPTFIEFFARIGQSGAVLVGLLALVRNWSGPWQGISNSKIAAILPSATQLCITLVLAYIAWHLVLIGSRRMLLRSAYADHATEAMHVARQARVATLLPLIRNTLLITIAAITMIIVISSLGIDVLPLLAGAGIVGIAIGMGSQTLVKDIISGIFFLADDALRVGDLVDVGIASGTVERAGIRSVQIRHPLGAIHTIPFGEIKTIANKSRDWAAMWLDFRLPFDTDLERLKPHLAAMNEKLLEDRVHGANLTGPVESSGIISVDETAMIVRLVYKCIPGTQFALRAVVYEAVRQMFREAGVSVAPREMLIRAEEHSMKVALPVKDGDKVAAIDDRA